MIIVFLGTPVILMILYLIVAYRICRKIKPTMKDGKKTNYTDISEKLQCRFGKSIRTYKNVEDYYIIRNNLNYP